jgi:hypothetical protein
VKFRRLYHPHGSFFDVTEGDFALTFDIIPVIDKRKLVTDGLLMTPLQTVECRLDDLVRRVYREDMVAHYRAKTHFDPANRPTSIVELYEIDELTEASAVK